MPDFTTFDQRAYPTVDVRTGYGEWVATYEDTVQDAMDLELLDALQTVEWSTAARAADLGCGTGRTGAWLAAQGVRAIDGVDVTPEMLARARERGVFSRLVEADVRDSRLETGAYDLVTTSLVDEHLPDVGPLYAEAARLARRGATYVIVGLHPQFIMAAGMPTHFDGADGRSVAIETHVHLLSDHVAAAHAAGLTLIELRERVIDDRWLALKPKWERLRGQPVALAFAWRR